ncbi:MAG: ABC transporter ATP-binding protein [Defluviitaleaceae bacterium]|nr:ABC transporter ATP-binding protein [Defluviitaleaceae bacterium]MCL2836307.1 ABC transporter ATP-binding protein [Defluviitaleaceae bacterium]
MANKLLEIKNLKVYFMQDGMELKAVDDISYYVNEGETLGIVGESGCGKSVSSMAILRLLDSPPAKYAGGEILFEGKDMLKISNDEMRKVRGNEISVIFQEPMTSLNPIKTVGAQIAEAMILHQGLSKKEAKTEVISLLKLVRIPNAERIVDEYPFTLSGGMCQRCMIALALACKPKLLIADEPTTALDVTIQAQVLQLMNELKSSINASIIFITHDLGVIAEMADRVLVMYAGKVVEVANVVDIFEQAKHPYTIGLIRSRPDLETDTGRLEVISGNVPDLNSKPSGCPFHPRCEKAGPRCGKEFPPEKVFSEGQIVACWLYSEGGVGNE